MNAASQSSLFDTDRFVDDRQAASARSRMREMIERLKAKSVPYWRDQTAVILDDGAFQRAMRLIPPDEAQMLWADFDKEMRRLYAIWAADDSATSQTTPSGDQDTR
jgi:hypothetical protein